MPNLVQRLRTSHNDGLPGGCQGCQDSLCEEAANEIRVLRDALETFVAQWNACGPNSDFGRYFQNVRDKAVSALAQTEN